MANLVVLAVVVIGSGALILFGAPELLGKVGLLRFPNMPILGMTPDLVTQDFKDPGHNGIDIGAPFGTPARSVGPGKVVNVITDTSKSGGRQVIIRGTGQFSTLGWGYAHLSRIDVAIGQEVTAGQIIGAVGNSGGTRGAGETAPVFNRTDGRGVHLHFTVLDALRGFDGIDPEPFLPEPIRGSV